MIIVQVWTLSEHKYPIAYCWSTHANLNEALSIVRSSKVLKRSRTWIERYNESAQRKVR